MLLRVLGRPRIVGPAELGVDEKFLANYNPPLAQHPIDAARFHRVIEQATRLAGWDGRAAGRPARSASPSTAASSAYIAVVVEREPRPATATSAWTRRGSPPTAGTLVNAERVRSQLEGAFLFGLSPRCTARSRWKGGAVQQSNFRDYPLDRATPRRPAGIHIDLIVDDGPPGGVGEPGVPPVAPGPRQRHLRAHRHARPQLPLVPARPVA